MKKCPKCKAEIQEEARFCLYCMTSFEKKQTIETPKVNNRRWLYILATVLLFSLAVLSVFVFAGKDKSPKGENTPSDDASIHTDSHTSVHVRTTLNEKQNSESEDNKPSSPVSNNQIQTPSKNEGNIIDTPSGNTTTDNIPTNSDAQNATTPNNTNANDSSSDTTASNSAPSTSINTTTSDVTITTPTGTQSKYSYAEATLKNAYPTGYSTIDAPENAIVITKVNYTEESGNYIIPDTIDGKKVAAIMSSAFSDPSISSTVKSVTLPGTVRTIWGNAFKDCVNLTDLYIKSAVIGIYEDAFPYSTKRNGKLIIHCKRDCRDFDFYYYRNIVDRYDADYEEWNG